MGSKILLFQKSGVIDMSIFRTKLKAYAYIHMHNYTPTHRCVHTSTYMNTSTHMYSHNRCTYMTLIISI